MKWIARGYHYNVYDLGNGRVRKEARSLVDKILAFPYGWEGIIKSERAKKTVPAVYRQLMEQVPLGLLGNPTFLSPLNYEQDQVVILRELLSSGSREQGRRIVDNYIEHTIEGWRYGFADIVYNFDINNGLNRNNKMVLIDFNEITFSREEVERRIKIKRWLSAAAYRRLIDMKPYYAEQMDRFMTLEKLEENWRKNLPN